MSGERRVSSMRVRGRHRVNSVRGERRIRCALLAWHRFEWLCEACLRSPGLEVAALDTRVLGLPDLHNPFVLPTVQRAEVVLLSTAWYEWLSASHPQRVEEILTRLEGCAKVLVGVESHDDLRLSLPPQAIARMACVLKGGGLYRDRELYNHDLGPRFPGALWSERQRPREHPYAPGDLRKLRLSIPCFLWVAPGARRSLRAARDDLGFLPRLARDAGERLLRPALAVAAGGRRPHEVHCVGRLTHIQRLQALRLLDGFSGRRGITAVPEHVSGRAAAEPFWHGKALAPPERLRLQRTAQQYMTAPVNRLAFQLELRRHRIVFAPTGHGELTYRHMEALAAGALLVCQDLRHAEIMFPFENRRNVLFCRPDLSDLSSIVREALLDDGLRARLGREGRRAYAAWAARWREHLSRGIEAPIREALRS
ncbi:MAG TPA: glycosyltransferase [Solirubrobacteraceae bacterium]